MKGSEMMAKLDITQDVYGKFDQNTVQLFCHNQQIGQMEMTEQGNLFKMSEGYWEENHRFYKEEQPVKNSDHYVENCDEGWC
jgi:hypothetical protein